MCTHVVSLVHVQKQTGRTRPRWLALFPGYLAVLLCSLRTLVTEQVTTPGSVSRLEKSSRKDAKMIARRVQQKILLNSSCAHFRIVLGDFSTLPPHTERFDCNLTGDAIEVNSHDFLWRPSFHVGYLPREHNMYVTTREVRPRHTYCCFRFSCTGFQSHQLAASQFFCSGPSIHVSVTTGAFRSTCMDKDVRGCLEVLRVVYVCAAGVVCVVW